MPVLEARGVSKRFRSRRGVQREVVALDDIDLVVEDGESVGLVGESGSGKSTMARIICGLTRPDTGSVALAGREVYGSRSVRRDLWRTVQLVFQDPYTSLNPRMPIVDSVAEPIRLWTKATGQAADAQARSLLERVGIDARAMEAYPGRLSGGQLQRVSIARAFAAKPSLIVFDESLSALDVSVQAHVLHLLRELEEETGVASVFITHDLSVVRLVTSRVVVLRRGRIVETCDTSQLQADAVSHGYTRALLQAVPQLRSRINDGQPYPFDASGASPAALDGAELETTDAV